MPNLLHPRVAVLLLPLRRSCPARSRTPTTQWRTVPVGWTSTRCPQRRLTVCGTTSAISRRGLERQQSLRGLDPARSFGPEHRATKLLKALCRFASRDATGALLAARSAKPPCYGEYISKIVFPVRSGVTHQSRDYYYPGVFL